MMPLSLDIASLKNPVITGKTGSHNRKQIDEIGLAIDQAKRDNGERYTIKQMEKSRESIAGAS